jgi:uncharacterized protein (DUF934 family)
MPIVTEGGFSPASDVAFAVFDAPEAAQARHIELPNHVDAAVLKGRLQQIEVIRIPFNSAQDGRGFSLARRLRDLGYRGRLRAFGHVISDQFRYALSCGFDEVEISDELAARQPEPHWQISLASEASYRTKLAGRANATAIPPFAS